MGSQSSSECNPGDLIEIFRGVYQHWAIYVGDGYVVHLAPPSESPEAGFFSAGSLYSDRAEVRRERLRDVAAGCTYRVNNELDTELRPRPVAQILRHANRRVGQTLPYDITRNNCEHFVTRLRYGERRSLQVERPLSVMGEGLTRAFIRDEL